MSPSKNPMGFPCENVAVRGQSFAGHVRHRVSNTRRRRANPPSSDPRKRSARALGRFPCRRVAATSKPTPRRSGAGSDAGRIPVGAGRQFPPRRGIESDSVGGADWIHPRKDAECELSAHEPGTLREYSAAPTAMSAAGNATGAEVTLDARGERAASRHSPRLGALNASRVWRAQHSNAVARRALRTSSEANIRTLGASWRNPRSLLLGETCCDRRREDHGQRRD